jgi:hypothetical protein
MADVTISGLGDLTPSTGLFLPVSNTSTTGKVTLSQVCGVMTSAQITTALGYTPYNSDNPGTGSLGLPAGTTAQRPTSPQNGTLRYNTSTQSIEVFTSGSWLNIKPATVPGSVTYTSNATFIAPAGVTEVKVTVISGGGGGAGSNGNCGGAGGGTGGTAIGVKSVTPGTSYAVVVGGGGGGGGTGSSGGPGGQSSFNGTTIYATGGGGGGFCGGTGGSGTGVNGSLNLTGSTITGYGYGGSGTAKAEYGATGGAGGPGIVVLEWS